MSDRRKLALLLSLTRGAHSSDDVAARMRAVVLWMLLAGRLAAAGRTDTFTAPHRPSPSARRTKGRRLARGSITGRRPRG